MNGEEGREIAQVEKEEEDRVRKVRQQMSLGHLAADVATIVQSQSLLATDGGLGGEQRARGLCRRYR